MDCRVSRVQSTQKEHGRELLPKLEMRARNAEHAVLEKKKKSCRNKKLTSKGTEWRIKWRVEASNAVSGNVCFKVLAHGKSGRTQ